MLNDPLSIRNYQKITDSLVDMSNKGYTRDELRLFVDGYLAALRTNNAMEIPLMHRLESEVVRFLYDPSNFVDPYDPEPEVETQQGIGYGY